uniref:Uncharacterized protein n=1 Tax=Anguilla anguilla TaxID=7936 RepID=A0A0E9RNP0_ANGAN
MLALHKKTHWFSTSSISANGMLLYYTCLFGQ